MAGADRQPSSPGFPPALREAAWLVLLAAGVAAAENLCLGIPRAGGVRATPIWLPNALLLTALVRRRGKTWPAAAAVFYVTGTAVALAHRVPLSTTLGLHLINLAEVLMVAVALHRPHGTGQRDRDRVGDLLRFTAVALLAVCTSGAAAACWISASERLDPLAQLRSWTLAHAAGLVVLTPCLNTLARARELLRERRVTPRAGLALAGLVVASVAVFAQNKLPLLFLAPPALIWLTMELEILGAAIGILTVAAVALAATLNGRGPVTLVADPLLRAAVLQLFVVVCMAGTLPVALLTANRRRLTRSVKQARDAAEASARAAAESEARFRRLSEHASDVISSVRAGGDFQYVSPAITAVAGWAPEDLVGRRPRDFVHPDDIGGLAAALAALAAGAPGDERGMEYRFRRKDGGWVWIQSNPQVVPDEGGPSTYIDVARDVTERRELEAELRQARADAERAAAAQAEFLADMSHELRTPLTAVLGYASLLALQPELTEASRGHLSRVRDAGQALLATINDVLDVSRLEAGQVDVHPASVEPARLLRSAVDLFALQAESKGLLLRLEGAGTLPARVAVNPDRLRQVLLNLIGNAVKFTERGSVTVRVAHHAGRLSVEVADTGPGIAEADVAALFQRFSQVGEGGARRHGGTGLGLAICKGLVEAMGGEVSVRSAPGRGSVFAFHVDAPAEAPATAAGAEPPSQGPAGAGLAVLVADDNAANRDIARTILGAVGFKVAEARDGTEALAAASRQPFDVILLDLRMPGMDGAAVARAIRGGDGPNAATPLLAFSAEPAAAETDLWSGVVSKPIAFDALTAAVAGAAASGRARESRAA